MTDLGTGTGGPNRPMKTNSLFNITFEAEETTPALVPFIHLGLNDLGTQEIKEDIELQPLLPVLAPLQSTDNFEPVELESISPVDVSPVNVFGTYTSQETTTNIFAANSFNLNQPFSIPLFNSGSEDFLTDPPVGSSNVRQSPLNNQTIHQPETISSTASSVSAFYNPKTYNEIANNFNIPPPPTSGSFVPISTPKLNTSPMPVPTGNYNEITPGSSEFSALSRPPLGVSPHSSASSGVQNHFRLNNQKPVYAKCPGLISEATENRQFIPPVPELTEAMPGNTRPTVFTPPSFYSTMDHGPGYSFGEPIPVPTSHISQQFLPAFYKLVSFHWFYKVELEGRTSWRPFSYLDSKALEEGYNTCPEILVSTDGGRCDVDIVNRIQKPVYWEEDVPIETRRSSWFYKGPMDSRFIPYEEEFAHYLETEYAQAIRSGEWHKRLDFGDGEAIILQNANSIVHFCQAASPDEWGNLPESQLRPRVVKRGVDDIEIDFGEPVQVDHLVFLVHGIGAICDFKFRSITEAVDDFRGLSTQMTQNHFRESIEAGRAGRIEFLPVSWHKALHSDGGIDKKLKPITLPSIPKLRHFTNDTLLDILFYTSPVYCQTIVDTVAREMNRMYNLFLERNKTFNGKVALGGHSLGSVILFDLLAHQMTSDLVAEGEHKVKISIIESASGDNPTLNGSTELKLGISSDVRGKIVTRTPSYTVVSGGTGQPFINYPTLDFNPTAFFAMGSPTAMFVTVRGLDKLGEHFQFPTCPSFYNIFHPYDPVAYRMESLISENISLPPVLIPHHKGRKRFHLELKDKVTRVSADLKNKFLESIKTTWNTVSQLRHFGRNDPSVPLDTDNGISPAAIEEWSQSPAMVTTLSESPEQDVQIQIGQLNRGRRVDYVLQEAPVEILNEYLFALTSHVCYWESEDVSLFLLKEIYATMDIFEDGEVITQSPTPSPSLATLTAAKVDNSALIPPANNYKSLQDNSNPSSRISCPYIPFPDGHVKPANTSGTTGVINGNSFAYGMDPTVPMNSTSNIGPPPLSGFVGKI